MDEITNEIQGGNQRIKMENGETLANLLWMDNVAFMDENTEDLQEVINTTNYIALNNHIEFGVTKCKVVKNGREKNHKSP